MTYQEVYKLIASTEDKRSNVVITTKASHMEIRQNLYISSGNQIKIRPANSNIAGYNVTDVMADKWESIRLVKRRKKKTE